MKCSSQRDNTIAKDMRWCPYKFINKRPHIPTRTRWEHPQAGMYSSHRTTVHREKPASPTHPHKGRVKATNRYTYLHSVVLLSDNFLNLELCTQQLKFLNFLILTCETQLSYPKRTKRDSSVVNFWQFLQFTTFRHKSWTPGPPGSPGATITIVDCFLWSEISQRASWIAAIILPLCKSELSMN